MIKKENRNSIINKKNELKHLEKLPKFNYAV